MPTARKLPSGSWRCLVFSHNEPLFDKRGKPIIDPKTGKQKEKRVYESFTCDDPSRSGKRTAEAMAAQFAATREKRNLPASRLTFGEALEKYIEERSQILSPSTIRKYRSMQRNCMKPLENYRMREITQDIIQAEINAASLKLSPKTVRDMNGLITSVMNRYSPDIRLQTVLPKKQRSDIYVPKENEIKRLVQEVTGTVMEVVLNEESEWIVKTPKSYAGDRYVTIPGFATDKFRALPGDTVGLTPNDITNRFQTVLKHAGLPHFRFHDLRHYNASIQHALGIPDAYIMQSGGWGNDSVLKEVYRHALPEIQEKMENKALEYFEKMQHDMQHKT